MYVHEYYTRCTCGCVSVCLLSGCLDVSLARISLTYTYTYTYTLTLTLRYSLLSALFCPALALLFYSQVPAACSPRTRRERVFCVLSCPVLSEMFHRAVHSCL